MSHFGKSAHRFTPEDLRIKAADHPDWVSGAERVPQAGERVLCTAGAAEVVQVLGKTGDGSRLLSLRLLDGKQPPFFVASSNVLLPPAMFAERMIG
jgi:hypothetical protein